MDLSTLQSIATAEQLSELAGKIERAVVDSFRYAPLRSGPTMAEATDRSAWLVDLVIRLRRELGWSIERVGDVAPQALRAKLLGIPWAPSRQKMWTT